MTIDAWRAAVSVTKRSSGATPSIHRPSNPIVSRGNLGVAGSAGSQCRLLGVAGREDQHPQTRGRRVLGDDVMWHPLHTTFRRGRRPAGPACHAHIGMQGLLNVLSFSRAPQTAEDAVKYCKASAVLSPIACFAYLLGRRAEGGDAPKDPSVCCRARLEREVYVDHKVGRLPCRGEGPSPDSRLVEGALVQPRLPVCNLGRAEVDHRQPAVHLSLPGLHKPACEEKYMQNGIVSARQLSGISCHRLV